MKNIEGEVRVSVRTFAELLEAEEEAQKVTQRRQDAVQMLGDFLQFLGTKDYFEDIQQEFNASHNRLSIKVDENTNRVVLYLDGQKIQRKD